MTNYIIFYSRYDIIWITDVIKVKKVIGIIIGKCALFLGKRLHRGSSLPGSIALKIDPDLNKKFRYPKQIIAVTGSSGKGSITGMLADILRDHGYKVAHNAKGSNLNFGITTMLLENCSLTGKINADIIIAEVDERYAKYVFPTLKPNYVVISNITRDQPPRQGHFDLVYEEIKKSLTENMKLILNADDPMLQKFSLEKQFKVFYYGVSKNKTSYNANKFENLNFTYCPLCHTKLTYDYYHFEELGNYHCPQCKFKKPIADHVATNIDYVSGKITIGRTTKMHIPYQTLYCVYNTLAAFTVARLLGLKEKDIATSIDKIAGNTKNISTYNTENRTVHVLNNKNENSSTFNQSLLYVDRDQDLKTIVIGWKEISRRYEFDDLSWLYDIDFEILKNHNLDSIVCVGIHRYDIAVRMKNAGIEEAKIKIFHSLEEAVPYIKTTTNGTIFALLNFDYVEPFNTLMNGSEKQ